MSETELSRENRWQRIILQLEREYRVLPETEKDWIAQQLRQIDRLQRALDELFRRADGEAICALCKGACCAKGHNHAGLVPVLACLQEGKAIPAVDFTVTCPWLGADGCSLAAGCRPYSCISFLCGKLEERLSDADVDRFYRLERELRTCYLAFAERYAGGGMSGLLLQDERLKGGPFLSLKPDK